MQLTRAEELRREWGDKPCAHPKIVREYIAGMHTGYVCSQCGKDFDDQEREEFLKKNRKTLVD